jgi:hypothetical protein
MEMFGDGKERISYQTRVGVSLYFRDTYVIKTVRIKKKEGRNI